MLYLRVFFYFLCFELNLTGSQYFIHVDFQTVGGIDIDGKTYDIVLPTFHETIKPSAQTVRDFVLRRGSADTDSRVFVDKDGLRHYWSGIGEQDQAVRIESLSTAELALLKASIENNKHVSEEKGKNVLEAKINSSNYYLVANAKSLDEVLEIANLTNSTKKAQAEPDEGISIDTDSDEYLSRKSKGNLAEDNTAADNDDTTATKTNEVNTTVKKRKKKAKRKIRTILRHGKKKKAHMWSPLSMTAAKPILRQAKKGINVTAVTIKFYCPYIGIFSMHSYLEDETTTYGPNDRVIKRPQKKQFD